MTPLQDKSRVIAQVCDAIASGDVTTAAQIARGDYPFAPQTTRRRNFTPLKATSVFLRDGFVDRYFGTRLVFPGALRLLSLILPAEFPAHPNWKMAESHIVYWELFPTVDHIIPVARGGADTADNWVTTSMVLNSTKANWTLAELDWNILPPGNPTAWDGLLPWFLAFISGTPEHLQDNYTKTWYSAAIRAKPAA